MCIIHIPIIMNFMHIRADGKGEVDDGEVDDGDRKTIPISLEDILIFATGAASVPPMGFSELPRIVFKEDSTDLPTAALTRCMCLPSTTTVTTSLNTNSSLVLLASEKCKIKSFPHIII